MRSRVTVGQLLFWLLVISCLLAWLAGGGP